MFYPPSSCGLVLKAFLRGVVRLVCEAAIQYRKFSQLLPVAMALGLAMATVAVESVVVGSLSVSGTEIAAIYYLTEKNGCFNATVCDCECEFSLVHACAVGKAELLG